MKKLLLVPLLTLLVLAAQAGDKPFKQVGSNKIYFSAFNSSFISPDIANIYNITRGKDKGMVNIAVVTDNADGGRTAMVKGTVSNIFAQQQALKFFEVREGDAVYYLAPFEFENEDSMTFKIQVNVDPNQPSESLSFQRKFYHD